MTEPAPRIIAHRGFAGVAPENTLGAFEAVGDGRHQADMIEFDVMPSKDGDVVVFHDHRLDDRGKTASRGITDGTGVVWEIPTETLCNATILGSDETVPLLAEVLDVVPPTIGLNVELRNPGTFDIRFGEALPDSHVADRRTMWDPFVERVVTLLDDVRHELLFSSFCEAAIASARDIAPDIPVGVNVHDSIEDALSIVDEYECEGIHPRLNMIKGTPFFETSYGSVRDPDFGDIDLLTEATDRAIDVNVWTIKTWRHAGVFDRAGVDGLIADYPGLNAESGISR